MARSPGDDFLQIRAHQAYEKANSTSAYAKLENIKPEFWGALRFKTTRHRRSLLTEQIAKTDFDRCGLKTEHCVSDYGDRPMLRRCLGCGQVRRNPGFHSGEKPYPIDDLLSMYVA